MMYSKKAVWLAIAVVLPICGCGEDKPNVTINGPVTMVNQMNIVGSNQGLAQGNLAPQTTPVRGAESGKKQRFNQYVFIQPDCSAPTLPTIKIAKQPFHGQLSIEQEEVYPNFPKDNARSACNSQKVKAMVAYYTSEAGFTGTDNFSLETIFPTGGFTHQDYTMNVR